jgi:hypothetical protein
MSSMKMIVEIRPLAGCTKGYKGTITVKNEDGSDYKEFNFESLDEDGEELGQTRLIKHENISEDFVRNIVRENCYTILTDYVSAKIVEISSAPPNARLFSVEIFPRPWLDLEVSDFE